MFGKLVRKYKEVKSKNEGFTLIELIIVIAILAVLALVLVPNISKFVNKSEVSRDQSNAKALYNAAVMAAADPSIEKTAEAVRTEAADLANLKDVDANFSVDVDEKGEVLSVTYEGQTFDGTNFSDAN